jgi:ribosomal protein L11 methyltransferase
MLMAEISEIGFDTFMVSESGFEAFAEEDHFDMMLLEEIVAKYKPVGNIEYSISHVQKQNWNEDWEKSYEPIIVDNKCLIRAHFHEVDELYPHVITITPKMSFGTGHHQTTYLMIKAQMTIDHVGKVVMDAGCGTAILSIMAEQLGARKVQAFDIDDWSVVNGNENLEVNNCQHISIRQGKISDLSFDEDFDIILANINKNILLQDLHQYAAYLKKGGKLLLSGF